jgi:[ribosomal protein S5]-alanine N-acetyltransferase
MCAELTVRPIGTRRELARVVEYFHNADDTALRNMGVDRARLPDPQAWLERLCRDLNLDNRERQTFFVSWMNGGHPIGHSNINKIAYSDQAYAHLHLWNKGERAGGFGEVLIRSKCISSSSHCGASYASPMPRTPVQIGYSPSSAFAS